MMYDMFPTSRLYQLGAQEIFTPSSSKLPQPNRGGVFQTNDQTQENTTPATACLKPWENICGLVDRKGL